MGERGSQYQALVVLRIVLGKKIATVYHTLTSEPAGSRCMAASRYRPDELQECGHPRGSGISHVTVTMRKTQIALPEKWRPIRFSLYAVII